VLFGVMSGPVGWAIFAGVGEIMGILALAGVFMSIIEASKERDVSLWSCIPRSAFVLMVTESARGD
jgi:hypothetical protein